jgi:hypothetical protein
MGVYRLRTYNLPDLADHAVSSMLGQSVGRLDGLHDVDRRRLGDVADVSARASDRSADQWVSHTC